MSKKNKTSLKFNEAESRIKKLRDLINDYRYHYHVLDESLMSEEAADSLKHELSTLEEEFPELITPDSPTQRVAGKPLDVFKSVKHTQRMLSLNDVFNEAEINAWLKRLGKLAEFNELFIDLKMDGLACALVYEDGNLIRAVTRGDGFEGEDVTLNVRTIDSVPLKLHSNHPFTKGYTEVRGEIVMHKADFEKLNEIRKKQNLPLFANPRNLAAGTIRQLDPKLVAKRPLNFRAYDLMRSDASEIPTYSEAYNISSKLGFKINKDYSVVKPDANSILNVANKWLEKRSSLAYNIDGLVVKVNNRKTYHELGVVGKAPRAAVAYKFPAEQATTKVKDIFISIGRTGAATPVAVLEPVVVAGSTVQMATLHNEGEVKRKDIRIGDSVIIHKAGDIIPEIIEPLVKLRTGKEKKFEMPTICPECRTELIKIKIEDAVWRCPNNRCPSRVQNRIQHFASKSALDIEGLGEKNVVALLAAGLINETPDIYKLKKDQLLNLERFADISAQKLVNSIQAKKQPTFERFLYGLGIRHVGVQTALDLARKFKNLDILGEATYEELAEVDGIGEVVAESIVAWFGDPINQKILQEFKDHGVWPKQENFSGGKLDGQGFVVTGTLRSMGREAAAELVKARGGIFQTTVSKDTNYLVAGENTGQSKIEKAKKYGTEIINETAFLKIVDE